MEPAEAKRELARLRRCLDLEGHRLRLGLAPLPQIHRQALLIGDEALAEAAAAALHGAAVPWLRQAWSTAWTDPAQLRVLRGHEGEVNACALSADGRVALSGAEDGTVRLWDAAAGECRAVLRGHEGLVLACALSADGRVALSGASDGTVRLWDAAAGECLLVMAIDGLTRGALSADGKVAMAGDVHGNVSLFEVVRP